MGKEFGQVIAAIVSLIICLILFIGLMELSKGDKDQIIYYIILSK